MGLHPNARRKKADPKVGLINGLSLAAGAAGVEINREPTTARTAGYGAAPKHQT
ncbi:hypothetical protein GCM10010082_21920 [Kushneria pakistanensis]|uniref:Uncharacterized protein n=1 Tax=Kushneria pakistanensis TaxID=1508770 RepID=A0ABQ3FL37_9GAMM|nr:hypothetical protein GCM10010082_21920 [Kushneria pakistanensis]